MILFADIRKRSWRLGNFITLLSRSHFLTSISLSNFTDAVAPFGIPWYAPHQNAPTDDHSIGLHIVGSPSPEVFINSQGSSYYGFISTVSESPSLYHRD